MTDLQVPVWTLGDRLRKARESAGLSQDELAEELDFSRGSVAGYERDVREPRRAFILAVAMRCGVPAEWLEHGDNEAIVRSRCFSRVPAGTRWTTSAGLAVAA